MNRRVFIFAAGSTLVAQTAPSRQVVVGLIGAGARGSALLQACLADPSVRIGAVCEVYEPRMFAATAAARSAGHRARYYRIYTDLLADKDLDAVIIATPDFWHHRMTLEALKAGKDVYLEPPISLTWQEAVELAAVERESRQVIQVGLQLRSRPLSRLKGARLVQAWRSADYLSSGVLRRGGFKLSDPLNFVDWQAAARMQVPYSPDRFLNWRFYSMYGGGIVTDLGCSVVDAIHILTGAAFPVSVKASGIRSSEEGFDTAERAVVTVEYPQMLVFLALDGAAARHDTHWSVDTDAGRTEFGPVVRAGEPDLTRVHLANFFDSVRNRQSPVATVAQTSPATLICQMANLSISAGTAISWNAATMRVERPM
jgi:predicted dehydrogenase